MSSSVDGGGLIAAAVIVPAAAAYGAGWLAWRAGKLLVDANRAVDQQIADKRKQMEEAAKHRKNTALAAHGQLVDMCHQILANLDSENIADISGIEQLRCDLQAICDEEIPEDVARIESITSLGYLKLDAVVHKQRQIAAIALSNAPSGLYQGLSVADLMDDLRISISAMEISATTGRDIKAADPVVLERVKLNAKLAEITDKIMAALRRVNALSEEYGLTTAGDAWFHSCFNGMDALIELLHKPTTPNSELKRGIKRLEESLEQYRIMAPVIEKEIKKIIALYRAYVDASHALGEEIVSIDAFENSAAIEKRLFELQERAKRAEECAEVYRKLGHAAYICYAWDQELKAMGYAVHSRKDVAQMADSMPERAKQGEVTLPFYQWNGVDLTQLYSISSQCSLQLIVHDDGTVTMQTIAESDDASVVPVQQAHCEQLRVIYERLRRKWFLIYDYQETEAPDQVTTISGWRASEENAWAAQDVPPAAKRRKKEQPSTKAKKKP